MKTSLSLIAGLCAMLVSGCSTTWQYVKIPDQSKHIADLSRCRIYLIRSAEEEGRVHVNVVDDKKLVGSTGPQGYLCWERKPGQTTLLSSSEGDYRLSITLTTGQVYYVIQHVGPGRFFARTSLEMVTGEQGQTAMRSCRPPMLRAPPNPMDSDPTEPTFFAHNSSQGGSGYRGPSGGGGGGGPPGFIISVPR